MGCDIHFYVERRENGCWVTADTWEKDEVFVGELTVTHEDKFYSGRNYNLFAILANVRNGSGFAGVKTGDGFNYIAEPRGIPDDASSLYKSETFRWGGNGHSHSWLTVQELMDFNWTQVSVLQGVVDLRNWARWKLFGRPEEYSGGVFGRSIRTIDETEFHSIVLEELGTDPMYKLSWAKGPVALRVAKKFKDTYTSVLWEVPYYTCGGAFLSETLPRLWRLGSPEEVRILFFFDN